MNPAWLVFMVLAPIVLVGLLAYLKYQEFQSNRPIREAEVSHVPLAQVARNDWAFGVGVGVGCLLYGILKIVVHTATVATQGLERFGSVRGLVDSHPPGSYIFFCGTMLLAFVLLVAGVLSLLQWMVGRWIAAVASGVDLLVSLAIGLALFGGPRDGGLILVLASCVLPMLLFSAAVASINARWQHNLKRSLNTS